jgi:hypothetical protein
MNHFIFWQWLGNIPSVLPKLPPTIDHIVKDQILLLLFVVWTQFNVSKIVFFSCFGVLSYHEFDGIYVIMH